MIHRAPLGSRERIMAILLEHHKGAFPLWKNWIEWAKLCKEKLNEYNLPLDALHVVNHNEINLKRRCPGIWFRRFYLKLLIQYV